MRIAVLSDTHDHLPALLPPLLAGADEIWHLGDVGVPETLDPLIALGRPLRVVRGNNDHHPWPERIEVEAGGLRLLLVHIPPRRLPRAVDVLLHGHTHVPRDETLHGVRWLNPGALFRPRDGSSHGYAWLELPGAGVVGWDRRPLPPARG